MSSIDERVVQMKFDNAQFERGVKQTMDSLSALNKGLNMKGATQGLNEVNSAVGKFSLANIASQVENISNKFRAMSVVAITAISNITSKALAMGAQLVKSLTIDPIKSGLSEYETNLNSIQTIMANTGLEGKSGLGQVNKALEELNTYSDKTIYNFSEMARNIGTFTAAGVNLDTSTAAIKGIANLAAISGSNSQQASTAMYQLSQALATGSVKLMDWNSVVNAGMGGKVFQEALKETARAHGVSVDQIIKKEGSFRDSLQTGWLSSSILTETLNKFTGDMTAAQLKQLGYTDKQIVEIQKMGKTAQDAATKVKTMSQLISTLQEAAGSGWAKTWQILFGDFDEARTLFTSLSDTIGGFITKSAEARNKVLGDWKALGGRKALIDGLSAGFKALFDVIKPIKDAFRDIFPATTGKQLYDMTVNFRNFMQSLKIGEDTADNLKRTFKGVFAIFDIGWTIIKKIAGVFAELFGTLTSGGGGFLEFTAKIGDWLVSLRDAIKNGEGLTKFFDGLTTVLKVPIQLLQVFFHWLGEVFGLVDSVKTDGIDRFSKRFESLGRIGEVIASAWGRLKSIFSGLATFVQPVLSAIGNAFKAIWEAIKQSFSSGNFSTLLDTINTGLFAGLVLIIRNFLKKGFSFDVGGGLFGGIKDSFEQLTGVLTAMQQNLKANVLLKIAGAIALLTVSIVALSLIDSAALTKSLAAISVMFVQLGAAMVLFDKMSTSIGGAAKLNVTALGLILLAIAIDILAIAVGKLAKLSWNDLAKGLVGVTVLIGGLIAATKLMDPNGMIRAGAGLILLALGVKILASAVIDLSGLSWGDMARGLTGVAATLAALALFTQFGKVSRGGLASGAGLLLLAFGIKVMASALKDLSGMSWSEMAKGLVAMAGGLVIMAAALRMVPPSSLISAAAVFVVAASLGMIADALGQLGDMSWGEIAKGLVALGGAMIIIAAALYAMEGALPGAAALAVAAFSLGMVADAMTQMGGMDWGAIAKSLVLLTGALLLLAGGLYLMEAALPGAAALIVAAGALAILAPVLLAFGGMSWESIGKGLLMLAGVFLVLGVAGLALTPVLPTIMGLGIAIGILGLGMLAAGAGLFLFSLGFQALVAALGSGIGLVVSTVKQLADLSPYILGKLAEGVIQFARVISTGGPAITAALTTVLLSLIQAINRVAPQIIATLYRLLTMLLQTLVRAIPQMVSAGMRLIVGILNGIAANIGKVITAATNVIVNFLRGIQQNLPRVIQEGIATIIAFVNGVANGIRANTGAMNAAGRNLASAIIEGMVSGISGGVGAVVSAAKNMAQSALDGAMNLLGIKSPSKAFEKIGKYTVEGFVKGLKGSSSDITNAFNKMKTDLANLMKSSAKESDRLEAKLKKLTSARHKDAKAIRETRAALAQANAEHAKASKAYTQLTKNYADERDKLKKYANDLAKVQAKLKDAQQALADAKKTRDDYKQSITDQYKDLPDISSDMSLTEYETNLQKQISDTIAFSRMIQTLRDMGLNDTLYKELLSKGPSALPFIQEIIDGGAGAVSDLNNLSGQLDKAASDLGTSASTALYQAGVDMAQGVVDGLKKQEKTIQDQMNKIATEMVKAIKKALGIKSPSKAFYEIGEWSAQGMVDGLESMAGTVADSAQGVGHEAINSLRKSISGMDTLVGAGIELNPTITPVLDLSLVKKDAGAVGDMLAGQKVAIDSAYSMANAASAGYQANKAAQVSAGGTTTYTDTVTFVQNNNSPKALSSAEIYRQTKNQISMAKGALKI